MRQDRLVQRDVASAEPSSANGPGRSLIKAQVTGVLVYDVGLPNPLTGTQNRRVSGSTCCQTARWKARSVPETAVRADGRCCPPTPVTSGFGVQAAIRLAGNGVAADPSSTRCSSSATAISAAGRAEQSAVRAAHLAVPRVGVRRSFASRRAGRRGSRWSRRAPASGKGANRSSRRRRQHAPEQTRRTHQAGHTEERHQPDRPDSARSKRVNAQHAVHRTPEGDQALHEIGMAHGDSARKVPTAAVRHQRAAAPVRVRQLGQRVGDACGRALSAVDAVADRRDGRAAVQPLQPVVQGQQRLRSAARDRRRAARATRRRRTAGRSTVGVSRIGVGPDEGRDLLDHGLGEPRRDPPRPPGGMAREPASRTAQRRGHDSSHRHGHDSHPPQFGRQARCSIASRNTCRTCRGSLATYVAPPVAALMARRAPTGLCAPYAMVMSGTGRLGIVLRAQPA